jgi:hypothetical protein
MSTTTMTTTHPLDIIRDYDDARYNRTARTDADWHAITERLAAGCRALGATLTPSTGHAETDACLAADVLWDAYTDESAAR